MNITYALPFLLLVAAGAGQETATALKYKGYMGQNQNTTVYATGKGQKSISRSDEEASKISMKTNVQSASLTKKKGDGNVIEVVVMDGDMPLREITDLQLIGNSGTTVRIRNFQSFNNVVLPFEGVVRFKSANNVGNIIYEREVRFVINETGRWVLRIEV